jgi:DNA-binding IclR family transcriptional regulator
VNEASAGLGVAPSTAHRLLRMIAHYGFVEQDPESKTYLPGPALQRMGRPRERFLEAARPVLRDLAEETQETVHLSVLEQAFAVTLLTAEGPHMLRVGDRTGHALPAWSSAMGRCLLFAHDDAAVRALVPSAMTTPDGSPMAQALLERVRADRGDGFAHHDGEVESGVSVAAVPVRDPAGGVAYAIGMTYPTVRIDREALPAAVTRLRAAAASLTVTLAAG